MDLRIVTMDIIPRTHLSIWNKYGVSGDVRETVMILLND